MKALIWIGCIFGNAIIHTMFMSGGVRLGVIPTVILFMLMTSAAGRLCKMWDEKHRKINWSALAENDMTQKGE